MNAYLEPANADKIIVNVDDREFVALTEVDSPLTRMAESDPALECKWEGDLERCSKLQLVLTRSQAQVVVGLRSASPADFELIETLKGLL